jgi:hypothetical protein
VRRAAIAAIALVVLAGAAYAFGIDFGLPKRSHARPKHFADAPIDEIFDIH